MLRAVHEKKKKVTSPLFHVFAVQEGQGKLSGMGIQECIIDVNGFSADSAITARQGVFVSITQPPVGNQ